MDELFSKLREIKKEYDEDWEALFKQLHIALYSIKDRREKLEALIRCEDKEYIMTGDCAVLGPYVENNYSEEEIFFATNKVENKCTKCGGYPPKIRDCIFCDGDGLYHGDL